MKKNILIIYVFMMPILLSAQSKPYRQILDKIETNNLRKHLGLLASDRFEGRETGTKGNELAAKYISDYFTKLGMGHSNGNSYYQKVRYETQYWNNIAINTKAKRYRHLWNFFSDAFSNNNRDSLAVKEVQFLGYGIEDAKYSDYKKFNSKGKVGLIFEGEPMGKDSIFTISNTKNQSSWSEDSMKVITASRFGINILFIIVKDFEKKMLLVKDKMVTTQMGNFAAIPNANTNYIYISNSMAKEIFASDFEKITAMKQKIDQKLVFKSKKLKCDLNIIMDKYVNILESNNVIGLVQGSDSLLQDQYVVISAHYDHLGKKNNGTYYGADDNGSGTTGVLEIANALQDAKKNGKGPKRSVICMLMTGEEKGLLGSKYYVNFPLFEIKNTIADVNIDMIGRVDDKYTLDSNYIYVIGADKLSTDLHNINETMNKEYTNMTLDYTYNDENDPNRYYYRSDHYNFAVNGIPAIFYFNGTHNDYHRTTDTYEKINFDAMKTRVQLALATVLELANRKNRIVIDKK
jgi:hypothetical protein